ncbi:MAG TPA: OsmC family protein [Candidatus Kryptonia bacterium]
MKMTAQIKNSSGIHEVSLKTNENARALDVPPKSNSFGSSVNGGEFLFLALATCYCNDIYREAAKKGMKVEGVEVSVTGDFGAEGEPAKNVTYDAKVRAHASEEDILELMKYTDTAAEIHNTLRAKTQMSPGRFEAVSVQ